MQLLLNLVLLLEHFIDPALKQLHTVKGLLPEVVMTYLEFSFTHGAVEAMLE